MKHPQPARRVAQFAVLAALAFGVVHVPAASVAAQDSKPKVAATKWALVNVNSEVRVMKSAEVGPLRKKLDSDWKEATRSYQDARKRAKKAKQKFEDEKPAKPTIKVLKDGFKTEADAEAARQKLEAKGAGGKASWIVVRVGNEHRVVAAKDIKQLKRDVAQADKEAAQRYAEAKKAAQKANEPFSLEKPKKTMVRAGKKFASQDAAEAHAKTMDSKVRAKGGKTR